MVDRIRGRVGTTPSGGRRSPVRSFQTHIAQMFTARGLSAITEWNSFKGEPGHYSPCVDIAVGPFARGTSKLSSTYDSFVLKHKAMLRAMHAFHKNNLAQCDSGQGAQSLQVASMANLNARCFLAIEVENKVTRKHLMGGAINAAALGRFGIAVGWTDDKVRALVRLRAYLHFLATAGKPTFGTHNLLILSGEQLEYCLL